MSSTNEIKAYIYVRQYFGLSDKQSIGEIGPIGISTVLDMLEKYKAALTGKEEKT